MLIFIRFFLANKPDRGFREVCHDRLYRYVWLHMQTRQLLSDQPSPWSSKYLDWKEIDLMMPSIQRLKNFHFVRSCQFKKKSKHQSIKILTLRTIFMCLSNQEKVSKYIPNTRSWVGMKHVKSLLIFGSFLGPWNPYQIPTVFFIGGWYELVTHTPQVPQPKRDHLFIQHFPRFEDGFSRCHYSFCRKHEGKNNWQDIPTVDSALILQISRFFQYKLYQSNNPQQLLDHLLRRNIAMVGDHN